MGIESGGTSHDACRRIAGRPLSATGIFVIALTGLSLLPVSPAPAAELTIRLCGMERVGDLKVAVFSQAHAKQFVEPTSQDFAVGFSIRLADTENLPVLRVTTPSLVPGNYAVRVTHDENSNGIVDFGRIVGTPQEAYGYSRNGRARVTAVSFDEAAITLDSDPVTIDVRVVPWSLTGGDSSPCPP